MRKIKWIRILLSVSLVFSMFLTGCGSSSGESKNAQKTSQEGIKNETIKENTGTQEASNARESAGKIVIFQSKVEIIDQLEELAEEYKAATGVEVEVWGTPGDDYVQQLKIKLSNNQGPTIFSLAPGTERN